MSCICVLNVTHNSMTKTRCPHFNLHPHTHLVMGGEIRSLSLSLSLSFANSCHQYEIFHNVLYVLPHRLCNVTPVYSAPWKVSLYTEERLSLAVHWVQQNVQGRSKIWREWPPPKNHRSKHSTTVKMRVRAPLKLVCCRFWWHVVLRVFNVLWKKKKE